MTTIARFLSSLPTTWKALTALGGAVAFGVAVGMIATDAMGVPAQVRETVDSVRTITRRIDGHDQALARINEQYGRIICLLTLPDDVRARVTANPILLQRECP